MPSVGLSIKWTRLEKEPLRLKIYQQKFPKWKGKEKKIPKKENQNRISKDCGTTTKGITDVQWEYRKEKKENVTNEIFKTIMSESFPKFMPTPNHTSRKLREYQAGQNKNKKCTPKNIIFKLKKFKDKEKILKQTRERKMPLLQRRKDKNYI